MNFNKRKSVEGSPKTMSTRYSANPEFAAKNKEFLQNVKNQFSNEDATSLWQLEQSRHPSPEPLANEESGPPKISIKDKKNDPHCWICHSPDAEIPCTSCVRSFHQRCTQVIPAIGFVCVECKAQDLPCTRFSPDVASIIINKFLKDETINKPLIVTDIEKKMPPRYKEFIINPMDISTILKENQSGKYSNGNAFLADIKWIHHNSHIFFRATHFTTLVAKKLVAACTDSLALLELCPQCFERSNSQEPHWFTLLCDKPHPIVMAKLRGHPYWPAKVLNLVGGQAKCWFFGAHDKSMVPFGNLLLISREGLTGHRRLLIQKAIEELKSYIANYEQKFGPFTFYPSNTNPTKEQLQPHSAPEVPPLPQQQSSNPEAGNPEISPIFPKQVLCDTNKRKTSEEGPQSSKIPRTSNDSIKEFVSLECFVPLQKLSYSHPAEIEIASSSSPSDRPSISGLIYHQPKFTPKEPGDIIDLTGDEGFPSSKEELMEEIQRLKGSIRDLEEELVERNRHFQIQIVEVKAEVEKSTLKMQYFFESEKRRTIHETRLEMEEELNRRIEMSKKKKWCTQCHQEAILDCCTNASYCSYVCQAQHWTTHNQLCQRATSGPVRQQTSTIPPNPSTPNLPISSQSIVKQPDPSNHSNAVLLVPPTTYNAMLAQSSSHQPQQVVFIMPQPPQ